MASASTTTLAHILKRVYKPGTVKDLVYANNPLLAMLPKDENFGGSGVVPIPTVYAPTAGRGATFSTAQANKAASKGVQWLLTRVKDYSLASIDSELLLASQGNERAFVTAVKREMDGAISAITRSMAIALYGDGSGSVGSVANSGFATTTLTLNQLDDITNFEVGDKIVFAASTTAALRDSGEALTVDAVDRDAGTITTSAALSTIASIAQNDVIFKEGDYVSASDRLKISGLAAWVPSSAPGATAFFGVDRSADVVRLGGVRVDGSALPLTEGLYKLATRIGREGGKPDCCFMAFENFEKLVNSLGAKVQYTSHKVGEVGFEGITVLGPAGPIKCFADLNCPRDRAYMLQMDTWKLHSLGPAPRVLELDGNRWLRESSSDANEVRIAMYGNLCCVAPGYNGVLHTLPTS